MQLIARVKSALVVVPSGVALGGVATVYHSAFFPVGLIVVIASAVLFFAGVRLASNSRANTVIGVASYAATVAVLAGEDSHGSVLVVADMAGFIFLALITLSAVVAIAWPKLSPRATHYDGESGLVGRTPPQ